jgi:fatty acid desaturase
MDHMTLRAGEWRTLALLGACYAVWLTAIGPVAEMSLAAAIGLAAVAGALHSSLQHEAIHGHPFRRPAVNAALVYPALTFAVPYARFRDLHLAHHRDADLTDPYDDPESNYLDPERWQTLPRLVRLVLAANNTLVGRMLLGPAVGTVWFAAGDFRRMAGGDRAVLRGWLLHLPAVAVVVGAHASLGAMPAWAVLASAYLALSILRIRTFAEHRAHDHAAARTVVIEDRGPLALLFLNNNLHVVHHMHPAVPWFRLPDLYRRNPARYLTRNGGYRFPSYAALFRAHALRAKDPVPHPRCGKREQSAKGHGSVMPVPSGSG